MAGEGSTASEHALQAAGSLERARKNSLSVRVDVDSATGKTPEEWVATRLLERPNQSLLARMNGLYCQACDSLLKMKRLKDKSNFNKHFGPRHERKLLRWQRHEATTRQLDMEEALQGSQPSRKEVFFRSVVGDPALRRRCWAVRTLLKTGVPLNALSERDFADLVYGTAGDLGHASHLGKYIGPALDAEKQLIRSELADADCYTIVYDGATIVHTEVYVFAIRFVNRETLAIEQRLVQLRLPECSVDARTICKFLEAVCAECGDALLLSVQRDGVSVNAAAYTLLSVRHEQTLDAVCLSHGLALVGKRFPDCIALRVTRMLSALMSRSGKARAAWKAAFNTSPKIMSETRWWSVVECVAFYAAQADHLLPFLGSLRLGGVSTRSVDLLKGLLARPNMTSGELTTVNARHDAAFSELLALLNGEPAPAECSVTDTTTGVRTAEVAELQCPSSKTQRRTAAAVAALESALDEANAITTADPALLEKQAAQEVEDAQLLRDIPATLGGLEEFCLQAAAIIAASDELVKATYRLEGDGFLVPFVYGQLQDVRSALDLAVNGTPPVEVTVQISRIAGLDDARAHELAAYCRALVRPALTYLDATILDDAGRYGPLLEACKFAAVFDPVSAHRLGLRATREFVDQLGAILSYSEPVPTAELRRYLLLCSTFTYDTVTAATSAELQSDNGFETLLQQLRREADRNARLNGKASVAWEFWKSEQTLPGLRGLAVRVATLLPSSAGPERAFSMIRNKLFNSHNTRQLLDARSLAALVCFNDRYRE